MHLYGRKDLVVYGTLFCLAVYIIIAISPTSMVLRSSSQLDVMPNTGSLTSATDSSLSLSAFRKSHLAHLKNSCLLMGANQGSI